MNTQIHYPLIISDFDGTLVSHDGTIGERDKTSINHYVEAGGHFVISTGRMPSGILPRVRELGIKGYVCCCNGAILMDVESGQSIFSATLPKEVAIQICEKMEQMQLHIHVYDMWEFYCNKNDDALRFYQDVVKTQANLVLDKPLSKFITEHDLPVYKVVAMVHEKDNERVLNALQNECFQGCTVTKSDSYLVEVLNAQYSKGTSVSVMADMLHIPTEKIIAIGDQWNDLPMLKQAGLGIAMQNANQTVKEQADYVCPYTNEENAISHVIETFGFYKEKKE